MRVPQKFAADHAFNRKRLNLGRPLYPRHDYLRTAPPILPSGVNFAQPNEIDLEVN